MCLAAGGVASALWAHGSNVISVTLSHGEAKMTTQDRGVVPQLAVESHCSKK